MANTTKIKLYGSTQALADAPASDEYFQHKASYVLSVTRNAAEAQLVTVDKDEFVELQFNDKTSWFGDAEMLKEIFPELKQQSRSIDQVPELPAMLLTDDSSRSIEGSIALTLFSIFTKRKLTDAVKKIATSLEDKGLEKNKPGLYYLNDQFAGTGFTKNVATKDESYLLFIHGTLSSAKRAYGQLAETELWKMLRSKYENRIIAFEHRTLTESPFSNTLDLMNALPKGAAIDLVTHSRGGLVGELLMRFSESSDGFLPQSIALLQEEGHITDLETIEKIKVVADTKKITVNKFIRVACPAHGTSLLSERTDIFINTLINLINYSNPYLPSLITELKALIGATIDCKNDFSQLPGLEAQRPESVFMKVLNTYKSYEGENPKGFTNKIAVISGNAKYSLSLNGLKIILTKFFFKWQANDLVVDTASMYQGAKRTRSVQYYLDDHNNTSHFNYFINKTSVNALQQALFSDADIIPGFREVIGNDYDAAANRGIFGLDSGRLLPIMPKGNKPIVILLPGIMGSFLEQGSHPLWINYLRFATGGLRKLLIGEDDNIQATGIIKTAYNDLVEFLSPTYDVVVFPFDWRRPLSAAGKNLRTKIEELQQYNKPVYLIGHSMGGLVIRDLIINHSDTWAALNRQPDFKVILLGTPWLGSYRIPHVLSGKDPIIKQLSLIDFTSSKRTLINMFSKFPGLLDLLPVHGDIDFSGKKVWEDFIQASGIGFDAIPETLLKSFGEYQRHIKENLDSIDYSRIIYVAGKDEETIESYTLEKGVLKFHATAAGDQSVTWYSGIPSLINKQTSLYYTQASHGSLAKKPFMFQGIKDLLDTGTTNSTDFSRTPPVIVASQRSFESKERFKFEAGESHIESDVLGLDMFANMEDSNTPILKVSVSKGDLMFASYPVMIGHFVSDGLYSAELVANRYLDDALKLKHALGLYPGTVGTSDFFRDANNRNDFNGCIVVGLGQSELLNPNQLTISVEKAVENHLLVHFKNDLQKKTTNKKIGLTTLIMGAGYGGMPVESSCRAIMQGVINANQKVTALTQIQELYIEELEFIELFEDKSIACFNSLSSLIQGNSDGMNIAWAAKTIKCLPGARKRLLSDSVNGWWQRLSVVAENITGKDVADVKTLTFYSGTNAAREEKNELRDNINLIETLIQDISDKRQWSYAKAKTIFELLIPVNFKENIRRNAPILWVLDKYTAAFPWELLQTGKENEKPLCITAGMIRQLATAEYRVNPVLVRNNRALVIGDPDLKGLTKARQLQGAVREAVEVCEVLKKSAQLDVEGPLVNTGSDEILVAMFKTDYKILHIAAHGFFDANNPSMSGILIGKQKDKDEPLFITPQQIGQLPSPPELVFINSCFLGKVSTMSEEYSANRYKLAANIGTQLIELGVKAVVVAGWEVDDNAGAGFAKIFYEKMTNGYSFGDAVLEARKHTYRNFNYTNTWGAFQCYGDPQFILDVRQEAKSERDYDIPQIAENDLDNIISKSQVSFYDPDTLLQELKSVSKRINKARFDDASLLQKEATAYFELGDLDTSIHLYNNLFKKEKAQFSVSSIEKYQDIRIKKVLASYLNTNSHDNGFIEENMSIVEQSIENLKKLLGIWVTAERHSLIGSALMRKARMAPTAKIRKEVMEEAAMRYYSAYKIAPETYNFSNWLALKILLNNKNTTWGQQYYDENNTKGKDNITRAGIEKIAAALAKQKRKGDADLFWLMSNDIDICMIKFFLNPTDKDNNHELERLYQRLWKRTGSINKKTDQLGSLEILKYLASVTGKKTIETGIQKLIEKLKAGKDLSF